MSFQPVLDSIQRQDLDGFIETVSEKDIRRILTKRKMGAEDFLALLSPAARPHLEEMARRAQEISIRQFGRTIQLFTPMYLSNYCTNACVYCGFGCKNKIPRKQLSLEEVAMEARSIAATGLRHLLILTGDAPKIATVAYLEDCTRILKQHFSSVAIEIYAMTEAEYGRLVAAGVDSLTIYQETYNEGLYAELHPIGPKGDFRFRLDAPERGCAAGMRAVNVGALLGLDDWRKDAFIAGVHAAWLQERYPEVEISMSLPRMRPHVGAFEPAYPVSDPEFAQILLALRLFMPRCGITISTREHPDFRERILPLGVTKMSAGVSTAVGGHSQEDEGTGQFDISDERSVDEMVAAIKDAGYQPVFQDWREMNP